MKKLFVLLFAFVLIAAACGGDDDEAETGTDEETSTETAEDDSDDAMEEEDDDAMEEEDGDDAAAAGGEAGSGGELLLLQWQAPSQANGLLSSGTKDILAASLVNEPLARFDPAGVIQPTLAAEIPTIENGGVAEDFSSITWPLLQDVVWSDGTPFTADDVVFTWEYCTNGTADPEDDLTGCSADFTTVESVVADDDFTVTITFVDPQPFPYGDFVGYTEPIIQRAQFQDCAGEQASACTDENFGPIGTGPYMVTELRPEDTVTYEWNPMYRGVDEGKPFFGNVTIKGGGDAESAARSVLEIGEADYAWNLQVAPEILAPMEAAGNGRLGSGFTANVEHINLNQTDPEADPPSEWTEDGSTNHPVLYQNPEFARALSLAIDREALVAVGYGAAGRPTCTMWPVGDQQSTAQDFCLEYNPDEANSILDELGYVDSDGDGVRETDDGIPLSFDYVTSTNAVRQSNQDIVKANWAEIGVEVEMRNEDASLFFDGTSASDASIWKFFSDMEMFTNGATVPDPVAYLQGWITDEIPTAALGWPASGNMPRMSSAEYDELWAELSTTPSTDPSYLPGIQRLQDIQVEIGAIIPLIHRANVSAWGNDIQNTGELNGWDSEYWNIQDWTRG
ncbi:MAG: peptide ABC transporter substrate-binding protein [Actinomycetota bacterium]